MFRKSKKVFVAMSGGVDSSVAAALLCRAGYEVTGVFLKVWQPATAACDWRAERRDARRVAARLEIPLLTLNLEKEYKQGVVDYLVAEYRAGRTPNPDVMCNREIKFGTFYTWARAHGADFIATGHYGRVERGELNLMRSKDKAKDQTYFLWTLTPEIIAHTFFPVGEYEKREVRALAKKFKLPTAEKKDSQGLCFIGKVDFKDFLKSFIKESPGAVVDEAGVVIGRHRGVSFYTLGERHGFTILQKTSQGKPYYIIAKDLEKNILVASQSKNVGSEVSNKIKLELMNWFSGKAPAKKKKIAAQVRYHGELYSCSVSDGTVTFSKVVPLVAPGQSCVFYSDNTCFGGGVIA